LPHNYIASKHDLFLGTSGPEGLEPKYRSFIHCLFHVYNCKYRPSNRNNNNNNNNNNNKGGKNVLVSVFHSSQLYATGISDGTSEDLKTGQSEHPKVHISWLVLIGWSWQQYNVTDITVLWEKHTIFIPPWRWGQLVPPRRYYIPSRLHGVSVRKTLDFALNAVEANVL